MEAATTTPPAGRRPIEVGRVIGETFEYYKQNFGALVLSALAIYIVAGLIQAALYGGGFILSLLSSAVTLTAGALYTGFVVKIVEDARDGRRDFTAGELFSSASRFIVPLIVNGFLRGIAIAIGLFLLIIPGLFLMTIWAVTSPAIVVEKKDPFDAFGRSSELTAGERMSVFLTILVAFLITTAITLIIGSIGFGIGGFALAVVFASIAGTITAPVSALVASVLFFDLGGGETAPAADNTQVVVEY